MDSLFIPELPGNQVRKRNTEFSNLCHQKEKTKFPKEKHYPATKFRKNCIITLFIDIIYFPFFNTVAIFV